MWQIWKPQRHADFFSFSFFFLFFPFFFLIVSRSVKFESVTTFVQCEIWNLIVGWPKYNTKTNQSTEFKESAFPYVLLCLSYFLSYNLE